MNTEAIDAAITVLNEINALDPTVLPKLIEYRVPCNAALAKHPTVQVGKRDGNEYDMYEEGPPPETRPFEVGLLGIINGLFGVDENEWGHIYMMTNLKGSIIRFGRKETM